MNPTESGSTTLRSILHVLFKRKFQILIFFCGTVMTVAILTYLADPLYEAKAQILVKIGRENVYLPAAGNSSPIVSLDQEKQINSEIEILKSPLLAQKTFESLKPDILYKNLYTENNEGIAYFFKSSIDRVVRYFKEKLTDDRENRIADEQKNKRIKALADFNKAFYVEGVENSNLINVSFKHGNPQIAAIVVNKLTAFYLDHHLKVHKTSESNEFFQQEAIYLKEKLKKSEDQLKALKKQYSVTSLEEQQSLLLRRITELSSEIDRALSQAGETKYRIRQLRYQVNATPETISQGESVDHNPYLISTLEARLVELQLKEKQLLTKYTSGSRLVENTKEEIQIVKQKLSEQEAKQYERRSSGINPTYQSLQAEMFRNEAELKAVRAKSIILKKQLEHHSIELEKLNQIEAKYSQLQQEVEVDRQNYKLYLTRYEESRISDAMDAEKISNISLVAPAQAPLHSVSPRKGLNILFGILLGGFGGLALVIALEFFNDSFERPEDIERFLQTCVLTSIPEQRSRRPG